MKNLAWIFKNYDLIFLDIQLTSYNGIQLGHLIRRQCPKTPIIITSLYAEYLQQGLFDRS